MGRAKLKLELISKAGARMMTFKKRKDSLKKKLKELTTLCDVNACMIIYGPDGAVEPEIYPNNINETCRVITHFKNSKRGECKSFGLSDVFKGKIKEELMEKEKMSVKVKYPTWNKTFDSVKDPLVLRNYADLLNAKALTVKSRIEFLKQEMSSGSGSGSCSCSSSTYQLHQYSSNCSVGGSIQLQQPPYMNDGWPEEYNNVFPMMTTTNEVIDVDDYLSLESLLDVNIEDYHDALWQL